MECKKNSHKVRSLFCTTIPISSITPLTASSTIAKITGFALPSLSIIGKNSFLIALVAGNKRVPEPAAGITAIVQPGGSLRDKDSIQAANEKSLVMMFTNVRHFFH